MRSAIRCRDDSSSDSLSMRSRRSSHSTSAISTPRKAMAVPPPTSTPTNPPRTPPRAPARTATRKIIATEISIGGTSNVGSHLRRPRMSFTGRYPEWSPLLLRLGGSDTSTSSRRCEGRREGSRARPEVTPVVGEPRTLGISSTIRRTAECGILPIVLPPRPKVPWPRRATGGPGPLPRRSEGVHRVESTGLQSAGSSTRRNATRESSDSARRAHDHGLTRNS